MADQRDEPPDDDKDLPESMRARLEALIPEIVKRTFSAGMGAVFSTEEGIRRIAKEIPDVAGYLASTADTTKDKVVEIVAREVREFLSTMNLGEEIAKILTTLSFEVKTEIRFIPNSEKYSGVEPDVKSAVRLKRAESPKEGAEEKKRRFWRRDEGDDAPPADDDDEK
jgi:hypothetical protein